MKRINAVIYGLFGIGAILYGATALISPAALESNAVQSWRFAHILREQGAAAIFVGLMAFWCIFNYERRRVVHYFLMMFALLLAAIHWFDYLTGHLNWMSPLYNSVPFVILLTMTLLSRKEMSDERQPSSEGNYPPPGDLLSARKAEKLELEIKSLRNKGNWATFVEVMPIVLALVAVLGLVFSVYEFVSQQERDRKSRDAEQRSRLQNQIRSDADEILHFTGGQKPARSRVVFLLRDMNTILKTKLSTGQTLGDESPEDRRSLTEGLIALVINDCDFDKNPSEVGLANAVAEYWDDYSSYLKEDSDLKSLEYILFKYIEALKSFRDANPGYLKSFNDTGTGSYERTSKYSKQKEEESRYGYFVDLRDGILLHLKILGKGSFSERARTVKTTCLEEFEGIICNPAISKDALGDDFANRPCDY